MITKYLSKKISFFSVVCTLMVLFMHSMDNQSPKSGCTEYLYFVIVELISNAAVPLFFIISGILYFKDDKTSISLIYAKVKKRIYSLGTPFICATLFYILFFTIVEMTPYSKGYLNGSVFMELKGNVWDIVNRCFWYYPEFPIAGQLWYLRDLLVIIIVSPIICLFFQNKVANIILLSILFVFASTNNAISLATSFYWFVLGGTAIKLFPRMLAPHNYAQKAMGALIVYWLISILFRIAHVDTPIYLYTLSMTIKVTLFWLSYDIIKTGKFVEAIISLVPYSFFVFLFHQPDINIIRKLPMILLGKSDLSYSISFLLTPFVCGYILVVIAKIMKRNIPIFYKFILGGRA